MRFIDLSQPMYDACPNCPVHPPVRAEVASVHTDGGPGSWHMEHLSMASHTGSHLDAPLHKIKGGRAIDDFSLEIFAGEAFIVDLRGIAARTAIDAKVLREKLAGAGSIRGKIILLATGWGDKRAANQEWYYEAPFLTEDGAAWLANHGVKMVGIDHYSIGGSTEPANAATHTALLNHPVLIVEDLHFPDEVFLLPQPVMFMALPIHFRGFSGSFCRPVLMT